MYGRRGVGSWGAGGRGRGWNQWDPGRQDRTPGQQATASGYTYVGPCRCGFGPHAFYRDSSGKLVHSRIFWNYPVSAPGDPVEQLKVEKEKLERRLAELNEKIKE